MKRNVLILVTCILLVFSAFSAASAESTETVTTITCTAGSLLSDYTVVTDILDVTAIRLYSLDNQYGGMVLSINDTDVLTATATLDENGFYIDSSALGDTPLYFSWEDIYSTLIEYADNNSDMEALSAMLENYNLDMMLDGSITESQTDEEILAMMYDEETLAFIEEIEASEVIETGEFTLHGSDTANEKSTIVLDEDDIARAIQLPYVKQQIAAQMAIEYPSMSEDEINAEIEAELAEAVEAIQEVDLSITITAYTFDDEFVALEAYAEGVADASTDYESIGGFSMYITKNTIESAEFYQMHMNLYEDTEDLVSMDGSLYMSEGFVAGDMTLCSEDDETVLEMNVALSKTSDNEKTGEIYVAVYDEYFDETQTVLITFDQDNKDDAVNTAIALYFGDTLDNIKSSLSDYHLLTLNLSTITQEDSGIFSSLQNATPETSIQLLQMDDTELSDYSMELENSLYMVLYSLIENLPAEVSQALLY